MSTATAPKSRTIKPVKAEPIADATITTVATVEPVQVVQVVALPTVDLVKAIRKDRQAILVRHAGESVVDAVDTVCNVSRSIRAGVEDANTVGRMDAAHAIHGATDALAKAGAPAGKVAAFKWGLLARVASAKRK